MGKTGAVAQTPLSFCGFCPSDAPRLFNDSLSMNHLLKPKLIRLLDTLNHGLVEREPAIKAALLALLAGENLLLVGPPGTAKSLIARRMADCLHHSDATAGYFEYLLTKFSTPEEIFGPLSISELKADRFRRNTAGYLPSVRLAFLDEIFKASSSILNALLTILNERIYHNGTEAQPVPLQALIAASNELPTGQEELEALYDRFLVRSFVDYVSEEGLPQLLSKPGPAPTLEPLTGADLARVREAAASVSLPPEIITALQRIWAGHKQLFKEDRRENLSDRRLKKAVGLLRVSAATNGRDAVDLSDLLLLKDCLWNHPDNALKVRELVMNTLRGLSRPVPLAGTPANAAPASTGQRPAQASSPSHAKMGAVVKGYKGSGTEQDPILIETLHDLAGLERPEVGQQGYWFRQTADIDASALTSWPNITFQGQYNGGGYAINYTKNININKSTSSASSPIFGAVGSILNAIGSLNKNALFRSGQQSKIFHLRLLGLGLAHTIQKSEITDCSSSVNLLYTVTDSTILGCESDADLIRSSATRCTINQCESGAALINSATECAISQCRTGHVLIEETATACTIQDCQVQVNGDWTNHYSRSISCGGIVSQRIDDSIVERCVVTGESATSQGMVDFSGMAHECKGSTIRQSAFGHFKYNNCVTRRRRIASEVDSAAKLENNIALDVHPGTSDPNGQDGKSISAALWTQHYFEHTLGWDFDTVWQWNTAQQQPELRAVGVDAFKQRQPATAAPAANEVMGDLLTEQLRANLWL